MITNQLVNQRGSQIVISCGYTRQRRICSQHASHMVNNNLAKPLSSNAHQALNFTLVRGFDELGQRKVHKEKVVKALGFILGLGQFK